MGLTVLIGGARAGKSSLATRLAEATGLPVTFVATAEALDDEMKERIDRHRAERPASWETVEEPLDLRGALARVPGSHAVIVDCLTLWTSNLFLGGLDEEAIAERSAAAAQVAAARKGPTFVVTNEVGSGVVPGSDVGRRFRDVLGRVNVAWASAATDAFLVVAGRPIALGVV